MQIHTFVRKTLTMVLEVHYFAAADGSAHHCSAVESLPALSSFRVRQSQQQLIKCIALIESCVKNNLKQGNSYSGTVPLDRGVDASHAGVGFRVDTVFEIVEKIYSFLPVLNAPPSV